MGGCEPRGPSSRPALLSGCVAACVLLPLLLLPLPARADSCEAQAAALVRRGLAQREVLQDPVPVGSPGGACGCCAASASTRLAVISRQEMETSVNKQATRTQTNFATRSKSYDDEFLKLLEQSKNGLHDMFTKTYGMIYEKHAHLFSDLFNELEKYYTRGGLDLSHAMDEFFALLYKKMFTVINSQYHFDEKYLSCVSEHMKELQPFGDVPRKLAVQVKRAFVATRTFTRALSTAAEVARTMGNVRLPSWCGAMNHCGMCSGVTENTCSYLCMNRARACLPQYADLSPEWDAFIDTMEKVADRLLGPFNIANVVQPIDIKISEAIMNFQEHSPELSERVFQGCGKPLLGAKPSDEGFLSNSKHTRSIKDENRRSKRSSITDNSDDFIIETSFESLVKKNPFLLSRGNSRKQLSNANVDSKAKENLKLDGGNELDDPNEDLIDLLRSNDKRYISNRLNRIRYRRDANPDPGKGSKEIDFESLDFDEDRIRGKAKGKKKQGGKKKKIMESNENLDDEDKERTLERLVRDIRRVVRESRHMWVHLPHVYCKVNTSNTLPIQGSDEKCWNGTHVSRYSSPLAGEGTAALATNPEARGSSSNGVSVGTPSAATVTLQQNLLKSITEKLRDAYNGKDVDWSDDEDSSWPMGSGSGSGDDTYDTEEPGGPPDQEGDSEGSGHHPDIPNFDIHSPDQGITEDKFNPIATNKNTNVDTIDRTNIDFDNHFPVDHETNHIDPNSERDSTSTSGATDKQKMSLPRALITYLFPIVCVWFGGIITDIA